MTTETLRTTSWEVDALDTMGTPRHTIQVDSTLGQWLTIDEAGVRIQEGAPNPAPEGALAETFIPHDAILQVRRFVRDVPAFTDFDGDLQPIPWCTTHDHPAVTEDDPILGADCEIGRRADSRVACRIVRARGSNAEVTSWAATVGR